MRTTELIQKVEELEKLIPSDTSKWTNNLCYSFFITTLQFIRNYIGKDTEFYMALNEGTKDNSHNSDVKNAVLANKVLRSIKEYLNLNLEIHLSDKYNIKIDIISDFMSQAIMLASDKNIHPAAAGILMGASLEEFLKNLAEEKAIDLSEIKLTIDPISKRLYEEKIISKQDLKDITSWAGIRNNATHGNFEEVNDRSRILNALEGVNLFMRKYNVQA